MKLISLSIFVFLVSCSKHSPAPVYDKSNTIKKRISSSQPLSKQHKYDPKFITVNKGDTLYSIGFSKNIDYKYLAKINNIPNPYRIYPGQKLRLKSNNSLITKNTVKTTPIKAQTRIKNITKTNSSITTTVKNNPIKIKPVKIASKPQIKPITKPVKKTVTQAPYSNSRWIWPVTGKVISTFSTTDISRKGIDIASAIGKPVYASNNGTVVYSGDGLLGYGELIILKHTNNLLSAYAHNSSRLVKEGVTVKQGQQIAKSGKGSDGQGLLHFEIRLNGQPVNPLKYLPKL